MWGRLECKQFYSEAVSTPALDTEGPEFEPKSNHILMLTILMSLWIKAFSSCINVNI